MCFSTQYMESESEEEEWNEDNDNNAQQEAIDNDNEEDSTSSIDEDEIDELLEEGLPKAKRIKTDDKKNLEYNEKEIVVLEENSKNTLEVLPGGWIEVRHSSGMPIYLHRKTRVCTLAKPYFLGPGSARRHSVPLSAIPCLAYRRQEAEDENNAAQQPGSAPETNGNSAIELEEGEVDTEMAIITPPAAAQTLPVAKVATAKENDSMHSISPEELRTYCKSVFRFKTVKCQRFKTWSARRQHTKALKRLQLQRPTMPDGVKLISFPIHNNGPSDGGKTNKEYIMNPQGKSSVCILHEYVQHALRKQPSYIFKELENAATPYSATVVINDMQYGTGYGSSKKQAKADAAKTTLEILIPQMKEQLNGTKPDPNGEFDISPLFEPLGLFEVGISKICKNLGELPPYGLLLTCLQRNFGQETSNSVKFEMISPGAQSNKFRMEVGEHSVEVQAPNKKEGKQLASQELLALLHPNIKNFGAFVKLYGNNSIKSVKEKKQEEQQITTLQSKASANSPNWAILSKLKTEMRKLKEQQDKAPVFPTALVIGPRKELQSQSSSTTTTSTTSPTSS